MLPWSWWKLYLVTVGHSPRLRSVKLFICEIFGGKIFPKFIELCTETPCRCPSRWAPTWRPETKGKTFVTEFATKTWINLPETHKHWNNTFSNTMTVQMAKSSKIRPPFNLQSTALKCRSTQKPINSNLFYYKTRKPFELRIWINTIFYRV